MTDEERMALVPGTRELMAHFGYWPSFHDAQVLRIDLQRGDVSKVRLYTFRLPGDIDTEGFYVLDRHTIVTVVLEGVLNMSLAGFNSGNVLFGMKVEKVNEGFELSLESTYGVGGSILAKKVSIEFRPVPATVSAYGEDELEGDFVAPSIIN
jgi:hypothetical protein